MTDVLDRVRKLVALAAGNENRGEAANAAIKACELIKQHGIQLSAKAGAPGAGFARPGGATHDPFSGVNRTRASSGPSVNWGPFPGMDWEFIQREAERIRKETERQRTARQAWEERREEEQWEFFKNGRRESRTGDDQTRVHWDAFSEPGTVELLIGIERSTRELSVRAMCRMDSHTADLVERVWRNLVSSIDINMPMDERTLRGLAHYLKIGIVEHLPLGVEVRVMAQPGLFF